MESVKAASEIYSPVTGKVVEKNVQVEETPSLINTSCYDKGETSSGVVFPLGMTSLFLGWLFKLELSNTGELQGLMEEAKYKEYLKTQEDH